MLLTKTATNCFPINLITIYIFWETFGTTGSVWRWYFLKPWSENPNCKSIWEFLFPQLFIPSVQGRWVALGRRNNADWFSFRIFSLGIHNAVATSRPVKPFSKVEENPLFCLWKWSKLLHSNINVGALLSLKKKKKGCKRNGDFIFGCFHAQKIQVAEQWILDLSCIWACWSLQWKPWTFQIWAAKWSLIAGEFWGAFTLLKCGR